MIAKKGSMTIFMGMTIMMILSIFFSLLEVLHYTQVKSNAVTVSKMAQESMFADYCRPLWKKYRVLGIDGGYGGRNLDIEMACDRMNVYLVDNSSTNHLSYFPLSVKVKKCGLLTDNNGIPFVKECAASAMHSIPSGLIKSMQQRKQTMEEGKMDWEDYIVEGQESYEDALNSGENEEEEEEEEDDDDDGYRSTKGNPMTEVLEWKGEGVLKQLVDPGAVSEKNMLGYESISERKLNKGKTENGQSCSLTEKILFGHYLTEHFSNYAKPKDREGLSYEMEYVLAGKGSDKENLKAVAERLLALRGAMNFVAFKKDPVRESEAEALAAAMAGFTGNEGVIKAVKMGITAAWVYTESVMDVRTLLNGGKISLIKDSGEWTSTLSSLPAGLKGNLRSKNCEGGLDYSDYLGMMLFLVSNNIAGTRAMEVIEHEIRKSELYGDFRMDCCIYSAETEFTYQAEPVFASVITVVSVKEAYKFLHKEAMSYF